MRHGLGHLVGALGRAALRHCLAGRVDHLGQARGQAFRRLGIGAEPDALGQGDVGGLKRTGTGAQNGAGRRLARGQHQHGRHHRLRLEGRQHRLGHQALGHAGGRRGRQRIDVDVVFGAFERQRLHQAHQRQLGGTVIGLAEIAIQAARRGGHDDAAVLLRIHQGPDRLAAVHGAHQVHVHHQLKVGDVHLGKGLVTQDAGVVDQNVDPAPGGHSLRHHGLHRGEIGYRGAVGQSLATRSPDFGHHRFRRRGRAA